jgi:hypothetical protein
MLRTTVVGGGVGESAWGTTLTDPLGAAGVVAFKFVGCSVSVLKPPIC